MAALRWACLSIRAMPKPVPPASAPLTRRGLLAVALAAGAARAVPTDDALPDADWVHGYAAFGAPKYPRDFAHFDYVDPAAPKGGSLYLHNPDRRSSFDKFNPFTVRGNAPAGLSIFMFESLALLSGDEPQTMYGLLAEAMRIAPDKSSITFRLDPDARFSNGDPVTADDVKFSFEQAAGPQASPASQTALAGIARAVVLDARTRALRAEGPQQRHPVHRRRRARCSRASGGRSPMARASASTRSSPNTRSPSGPYTIARADNGPAARIQAQPGLLGP